MRPTSRRYFLALLTPVALEASWPQWRGEARDGHSAEVGLADSWPAEGPPLLWTNDAIGIGFSSLSTGQGQLFTQGQQDGKQFILSLNPETGIENWRLETGPEYVDEYDFGWGPRGAVTVDGNRLYAYDGRGVLVCADLKGQELWRADTLAEFDGTIPLVGYTESPLVDGNRVIVQPGGPEASIVAFNKHTGEVLWTSGSDPASYCSAIISEGGGVRQYITVTALGVVGVRVDDGEELWRYDGIINNAGGGIHIATPIVQGDHVFVSSDYGVGCALLKLAADGDRVSATEVYFNRDMRNHLATSILLDDTLYGFSSMIMTAMDFETGAVLWRDRSVGKGQTILADGKLYILSEDGVVGLVRPSREGYEELSRFEIGTREKRTWTLPVIADGRLYLRDQELLRCYDVSA
jgi:outer membrane protein assembly factor BamB